VSFTEVGANNHRSGCKSIGEEGYQVVALI
jgi:hypothetical protein